LKSAAFGRELQQKVTIPFRAICQSLYAESQLVFESVIYRDTGICDDLENQECTLMKLDFASNNETPGLELMQDMHKAFPLVQQGGSILRKDATAQAISLNSFVKGESKGM